jgi:drug/metabolite transporter (DMT)-like permease
MKPMAMLGIALLVVGVVALAYTGITYKSRDTVLDLGPLHATAVREHTIPLSPIFGVVAAIGGVVLLVVGNRKNA